MTKHREFFIYFISAIIGIASYFVVDILLGVKETIKHDIDANTIIHKYLISFIVIIGVILFVRLFRYNTRNHTQDKSMKQFDNTILQLKSQHDMQQKLRQDAINNAVKTYVLHIMAPYLSEESIETLCLNIEYWNGQKFSKITPITLAHPISTIDLRHLAWNIGERYKWTGLQRAMFVKQCFPLEMNGLEVETIRRNLRSRGSCTISLDIPKRGHYNFTTAEQIQLDDD